MAAPVFMPETTMYENDFSPRDQNNVWFPREPAKMECVSKAHRVE